MKVYGIYRQHGTWNLVQTERSSADAEGARVDVADASTGDATAVVEFVTVDNMPATVTGSLFSNPAFAEVSIFRAEDGAMVLAR